MTPDVNVLVAAARSDHPHHAVARAWLGHAATGAVAGSAFVLMPMGSLQQPCIWVNISSALIEISESWSVGPSSRCWNRRLASSRLVWGPHAARGQSSSSQQLADARVSVYGSVDYLADFRQLIRDICAPCAHTL